MRRFIPGERLRPPFGWVGVENADVSRRLHAPEALEDGEDDEHNAIELAGLSDEGGAR